MSKSKVGRRMVGESVPLRRSRAAGIRTNIVCSIRVSRSADTVLKGMVNRVTTTFVLLTDR